MSESVQSVGCQLFSPALKDVREGLFNMSDADKLMLMSFRSARRPAKLWHRGAPDTICCEHATENTDDVLRY